MTDRLPGNYRDWPFAARLSAIWLLLLALSQLAFLILWAAGYSIQPYLYKSFVLADLSGSDSWGPMRAAFDWLQEDHAGTVYDAVFFEGQTKFQYPLTSLLPYLLLEPMGGAHAAMLNAVGWLSVAASAVLAALLTDTIVRRRDTSATRTARIAAAGLTAVAATAFFPVLRGLALGQVQVWLNALFLLACLFVLRGRWALAGGAIGAICLFKPQLGLFLVWAALRRNWSFAAGFLWVAVPGGLLALAAFGLADNLDYLNVLGFISRHGEAFYANQSVNGLLNRLFADGDSRIWVAERFAPYDARVHYATLATSALLIGFVLLFGRQARTEGLREFTLAGLAFTIASPVAWEHHYGFLVPVFVVLAADAALALPSRRAAARLAALCAVYVLVSQDAFTAVLALFPVNSLAYSFFFFAACAALVLLVTAGPALAVRPAFAPSAPGPGGRTTTTADGGAEPGGAASRHGGRTGVAGSPKVPRGA